MSAAPPRESPAAAIANVLRAARRLNFEPHGTAATLFNALLNSGWSEQEILSRIQFAETPSLRLRHPQPSAESGLTAPVRHAGAITRLAFTADGSALFSCSEIGEIVRWQLPEGRPTFARHGHAGAIAHCLVLPGAGDVEQPHLLTAGADGCGRIWHADTGELRAELASHTGAILCLAATAERALTGGADATLRLWNLEHGTTMAMFRISAAAVTACAFGAADGAGILSGAADGSVCQWNPGGYLTRRFEGHTARVTSLTALPQFDALIATADDCTLRIWTLSTGELRRVVTGHILAVSGCIVLDDTDPVIVSWSLDRTAKAWRLSSGTPVGDPLNHDGAVEGCLAAGDDLRVISWSADASMLLWQPDTGAILARASEKSAFTVATVQDRQCAAATADGTLRIWRPENLLLVRTLCSGDPAVALLRPSNNESTAFWTDTNVVVVGAEVGELDVATGEQHRIELSGVEGLTGFVGGTVSVDGRRMLLWTSGRIVCFGLEERTPYAEWASDAVVDGAVMTNDGKRAFVWGRLGLAGTERDAIAVWNVETNQIERTLAGHRDRVSACVLIDDRFVCSASLDGTLRIWEWRTGIERARATGHTGPIRGCLASRNRIPVVVLLSWSDDKTVRLWYPLADPIGPADFAQIVTFEVAGTIATAAFGEGAYAEPPAPARGVMIGTTDGRIITYPEGDRPHEVRLHTHRVREIVALPERDAFASCADDGTVRLWRGGEAIAGAMFYASAPIVRLLPVGDSLVALDEHAVASVLAVSV